MLRIRLLQQVTSILQYPKSLAIKRMSIRLQPIETDLLFLIREIHWVLLLSSKMKLIKGFPPDKAWIINRWQDITLNLWVVPALDAQIPLYQEQQLHGPWTDSRKASMKETERSIKARVPWRPTMTLLQILREGLPPRITAHCFSRETGSQTEKIAGNPLSWSRKQGHLGSRNTLHRASSRNHQRESMTSSTVKLKEG